MPLDLIVNTVYATNSPALPLLLASMVRVFWRYDCRALRSLQGAAQSLATSPAIPGYRAWRDLLDVFSNSPINIIRFEKFIAEIEHSIKQMYDSAGMNDTAARAPSEKSILFVGEIPQLFMPVTQKLLTTMLDKLQDDIDCSRLYFADVRWLGLTEDRGAIEYQETHKLDILRKTSLLDHSKWRRCTRCRSCLEDIGPRGYAPWVQSLQKTCVCGNPWVLETLQ